MSKEQPPNKSAKLVISTCVIIFRRICSFKTIKQNAYQEQIFVKRPRRQPSVRHLPIYRLFYYAAATSKSNKITFLREEDSKGSRRGTMCLLSSSTNNANNHSNSGSISETDRQLY
jgi:hypothetical protein